MKNNKGFTLVELLAVIVIMGILMMVAIPSVTRTIENSRKDTFVDIAKSYGNAARTLWTSDNLTCNGVVSSAVDDGDYYILINSKESAKDSLPVLVDQGGKSSWGNRDVNGYVRVNISTIPGEDNDRDGFYEVEPRRVTKFYVALSDGTHGLIDDDTIMMDKLVRGNVNMTLSEDDLKKIELTVDDGRLDCGRDANGLYSCAEITPIKSITEICVDDKTNIGLTGNVEEDSGVVPLKFETDDWNTIVTALRSGAHPYRVGDMKKIEVGYFGEHQVRISNLSTPSECNNSDFSQTACGTVIEFVDVVTEREMDHSFDNYGGWPRTQLYSFLNTEIYTQLPTELKDIIIDTKVVSGHGLYESSNFTTPNDKLYLLSVAEVWAEGTLNSNNVDTARSSTRQLEYYQTLGLTTDTNTTEILKYDEELDINTGWWLRTPVSIYSSGFFNVSFLGGVGSSSADFSTGISPAFRIG